VIETVRRVVADAAIAAAEPAGWTADWAAPDADDDLDPTEYRTSSRYDALSRPVQVTAPADVHGHRAQLVRTYCRSGALRSVTVEVPRTCGCSPTTPVGSESSPRSATGW